MTANLLTVNSSKTECILIGNRQLTKIQNTSVNTTHSDCNLGFIFDEHLILSGQISALNLVILTFVNFVVSVLIRPPDIVCRRTYILPVFLLSFFFLFSPSISPRLLKGTQRKSTAWSKVSVICKRMSEIWDTLPLTNWEPQNTFLDDFAT